MKGFKTVAIVLLIALLLLTAGTAAYCTSVTRQRDEYKIALENGYEQSFQDLDYALGNIELNLSKLQVVSAPAEQANYLGKVVRYAEMAETSVALFAGERGAFSGLEKFFNQTADYSETAIRTLSSGGRLSAEEKGCLATMRRNCSLIRGKLQNVDRSDGASVYVDLADINSELSLTFVELEDATIEYPSLIYDGPFSDSLVDRDPEGLAGKQMTETEAQSRVDETFGAGVWQYGGQANGRIPSYFFTDIQNGENVLQVSQKGCMVMQMNTVYSVGEIRLGEEQCAAMGEEYLSALGYENMRSVWVSMYNGVAYVNYCYVSDQGVVYYPDMIKLKIAADDGRVVGMECLNYIYNHRDRTLDIPETDRQMTLDETLDVTLEGAPRYALIPLNTREVLCLEVCMRIDDEMYFVYYDADGNEVNVLKVVDTERGKLLQ